MIRSRPVVVKSNVSIPTPEQYEVPKEFREDILDAMRGTMPDDYQDAIKRYYETLVR